MTLTITSRHPASLDLTAPVAQLLALAHAEDPVPADQKDRCREIGQRLHNLGGFDLMLAVGEYVKARNTLAGALVACFWHGIGDWQW